MGALTRLRVRVPMRRAAFTAALAGLLATSALIGACDGTAGQLVPVAPDAGPPAPPPITTPAGLGVAMARAVCAKIDACCAAGERSRIIGVGEDQAACEASLGAFYEQQYGGLSRFLSEGRVALAAEKVDACLAAYRDAGCNAPGVAAAPPCAEVFVGTAQVGEPCEAGPECTSHVCPQARQGERVCVARKPDGAACSRGAECASYYCRTAFLGGMCAPPGQDRSCGGDGFWLVL